MNRPKIATRALARYVAAVLTADGLDVSFDPILPGHCWIFAPKPLRLGGRPAPISVWVAVHPRQVTPADYARYMRLLAVLHPIQIPSQQSPTGHAYLLIQRLTRAPLPPFPPPVVTAPAGLLLPAEGVLPTIEVPL